MSLPSLLSTLYAAGGIAACLFYLPQLARMARDAHTRRAMSLLSWGGWLAVSAITVLYALVVVRHPEMVLVAAANTVCQTVVVGLTLAQRLVDRRRVRTAEPPPSPCA